MNAPEDASLTKVASSLEAAIAHHRAGQLQQAEALYMVSLRATPRDYDVLIGLGVARCQRGRLSEGVEAFKLAAEQRPDAAEPQILLARAYRDLRQFAKAVSRYDRALALQPDDAQALNDRGVALAALGRYEEALIDYDGALARQPRFPEAFYNRGTALAALHRTEDALAALDQALALKRDFPQALHNRANALCELHRYEEAVAEYEGLRALAPGFDAVDLNLAAALLRLNRLEEALVSYRRALTGNPRQVDALQGCATVLMRLAKRDQAREYIEQLLKIEPCRAGIAGWLLLESLACGRWERYEQSARELIRAVRSGRDPVDPQRLAYVSDSSRDQLLCAQQHARRIQRESGPTMGSPGQRRTNERIRVAYLSADFHQHATAVLIAGLFERHDRRRFETIGLSYGPQYRDPMRVRLEAGLERFIDISRLGDRAAAETIHGLEVDILVDLKGYTMDARPGILARRPAPIQVSYLGFPGTMGAEFIDYLIADQTVIPESEFGHYTEQIVHLPDSYQVNDDRRVIAAETPTRAQMGLPEPGFVFCAFNATQKITPSLFDVWMRLLRNVEGSVLWLMADEPATAGNLRGEALRRGVDSRRLIFAHRAPLAQHLARHRLADLFLDTLPCNAHTTGSDALWASLPIVTCLGSTFAGRVGASLVRAVGLPELVTDSLSAYEALALDLATDPQRLRDIRARLAVNVKTAPLFDTEGFCRRIECAYEMMHARHRRGERPAPLTVA